jgi:hypothetical protein
MTLVRVHVRLAVEPDTGTISRTAPMMVWCEDHSHPPGTYPPNPEVLEQLTPLEAGGRFQAEWDGHRWRIGKRLND